MNKIVITIGVGVCLLVGGVVWVVLGGFEKDSSDDAVESADQATVVEEFIPRYSSTELAQRIEDRKKDRGGFPNEMLSKQITYSIFRTFLDEKKWWASI